MRLGFAVELSRRGLRAELFATREGWSGRLLDSARNADLLAVSLGTPWLPGGEGGATAVLRAHELAGAQGMCQLRGDFAAVVWDRRDRCLLAARDPLGGYPLFWARHGRGFALATSIRALAAIVGERDLDHAYLAAFLCSSEMTIAELATPRTCRVGIERVLPGTCLSIFPFEGRVRCSSTWSWEDAIDEASPRTWEEAVEGYRERLDAAVRRRLRGRVAAHLSGGMDSTSLCALAARALEERRSGERLRTISLSHEETAALATETQMIDLALGAIDAVPHRLRGEDHRPFVRLHLVPPHDEPAQSSLWSALEGATIDAAHEAGCSSLLSGSGGDFALEVPPFHLADQLARARWRGFLGECAAWAEAWTTSARAIAWVYGVQPLLRGMPGRSCRVAIHRGAWQQYDGRSSPPWMRSTAVREAQPVLREAEERSEPAAGLSRRTRLAFALVREHRGDWSRWHLAACRGVALAHPFLDPPTAAFALACVERLPADPSRVKPLLADAMGELLPEEIRARRQKVDYNDPFFHGLIDARAELERLVLAPEYADLGLVEPATLLDRLRQTAFGVAPHARALSRLNKALALALWVDRARAPSSDGSVTIRHRIEETFTDGDRRGGVREEVRPEWMP